MKILDIHISNINSIREGHIPFNNSPLDKANIFLISGPTGSGKSTILDAITLALYNRVPRFSSAINENEITKLGSIVTQNETSASATVRYEVKGKIYKSMWEIKQTSKKNWKAYHMQIFDESESKLLNLKKSEVPSANERIIGLSYDQFLKAIILSQGEFAQFLKSDHHERGELLEKLTGASIYRKIGIRVYELHKEYNDKLGQFNQILDAINILSDDEVMVLNSSLNQIEQQIKGINEAYDHAFKSLEVKKKIKSNSQLLQEYLSVEAKLTLENEKFASSRLKVENFHKLAPHFAKMEKINALNEQAQIVTRQIQNNSIEIDERKVKSGEILSAMSKLLQHPVDDNTYAKVMQDKEQRYSYLKQQISYLQKSGLEKRNIINQQLPSDVLHKLGSKCLPKDIITWINTQSDTINEERSLLKLYLDRSIGEWEEELNKKEIAIGLLQQRNADLQKLKALLAEKSALFLLIEESEKHLSELTDKKPLKQNQLTAIEKEYLDFQKRVSLEEKRKELVDGEPCPLCGSIDHPYSIHNELIEEGTYARDIRILKEEINQITEQQNSLTNSSVANSTRLHSIDVAINEKNEAIDAIRQKIIDLGVPESTQVPLLQDGIGEEKKTLKRLKELKSKEKDIQLYEIIKQNCKELEDLFNEHTNLLKEVKSIYDGNDFIEKTNSLQDAYNDNKTQLIAAQKALDQNSEKGQQVLAEIEEIEKILLPKLQSLGYQSIAMADQIRIPQEEYQTIVNQINDLQERRKHNEAAISATRRELTILSEEDDVDKDMETLTAYVQSSGQNRQELIEMVGSIKNQLKHREQQLRDRQTILQQRDNQEHLVRKMTYMKRLIGDAKGSIFSNYAQDLTLSYLIHIANKYLAKLSDRYLLKSTTLREDLVIYDLYQGEAERAVKTLSGGETFILSLAMAVALSDLASKEVDIRSIFIDEGFGTLDNETLDQAMFALESLQAQNQKTIGIISHVASLKERIFTQIVLNKDSRGYSTINITANGVN